jgi:hypothetical protein
MAISYQGIASVGLSSAATKEASIQTLLFIKLRGEQLHGLAVLSFQGHLHRPASFDRIIVAAASIELMGTVIDYAESNSGGWLRFKIDVLHQTALS